MTLYILQTLISGQLQSASEIAHLTLTECGKTDKMLIKVRYKKESDFISLISHAIDTENNTKEEVTRRALFN